MISDAYYTIKDISKGVFKSKGSKFLAFGFPVFSEEQVKYLLTDVKKKYHDARHHCYAYKIGPAEDRYRMNDDGEPSGTAGKPVYGQILSHNLSDILIIVVRYFGGTLLGTSGLINAYKLAAADCISSANIIERVVKQPLQLEYSYDLMSAVMRIVKDSNLEVLEQDFRESCRLKLNVRLNDFENLREKYKNIFGVKVE